MLILDKKSGPKVGDQIKSNSFFEIQVAKSCPDLFWTALGQGPIIYPLYVCPYVCMYVRMSQLYRPNDPKDFFDIADYESIL